MKNEVYIIAELSANHNNDYGIAEKTIAAMKEAGANAVKFQTYTPDSLSLDVDNEFFGPLKAGLWAGKRPYQLYEEAAMPWEWQKGLSEFAKSIGLDWLSSPFDFEAVDFLESINVPSYKIASPEITDIPLIEYVASKKKPVIISTGIATKEEIQTAIDHCNQQGNNDICLLKCTSQYPAKIEDANMLTIPDMIKNFGPSVGLSDHSPGSIVPVVAVSFGAKVIEKHFILSRSLGGPDSSFSMEPLEFKQMVEDVRNAESAIGLVDYSTTEKDRNRRRSLFVVQDVKKGDLVTKENIRSLRPGYGLHPSFYKTILGKNFKKDLKKGDPLSLDFID